MVTVKPVTEFPLINNDEQIGVERVRLYWLGNYTTIVELAGTSEVL